MAIQRHYSGAYFGKYDSHHHCHCYCHPDRWFWRHVMVECLIKKA